MSRIIFLANQEGGVGKTTITIDLTASLAVLEEKVLIVDADPQANVSSGLGVNSTTLSETIYECLIGGLPLDKVVRPTHVDNLFILPSHIDLVGTEIEMLQLKEWETVTREMFRPAVDQYDYILIDCSPSLDIITVSALVANHAMIIPAQCEHFALKGISKLLNTIRIIKSRLSPALEIEGFLLTMYDGRLRLVNQMYKEVKEHFGQLVPGTVIQRNVKLSEAPSHGLPALFYDADSKGAINHLQLAEELIRRTAQHAAL